MNKMDTIFGNSGLIAKKIAGQLTEQENDLFNQWLNSSKRNQILFERIKDSQNFLSRNEEFESVNTEQAWDNFTRKISAPGKMKTISLILRYAAAILLPLVIGTSIFLYFHNQYPLEEVQVSTIQPGMRNAFLVLNNGQNINLENNEAMALKEADGTVIENANDELNYASQQSSKSKKALQNTLVVPRGGEYSLVLSDGTQVCVNSMSKLVFPVHFTGNTREVSLEGEAYFKVQKDAKHPFVVNINGMQIKVLGTSFNVKAYQDEQNVYTTLVEGAVKISPLGPSDKEWLLNPDQQAVFDKTSVGVEIRDVDASQYIQWALGKYVFTNQSLDEIMKTLSRWYDFTYSFRDESLKAIRFEGGLNKYESIDPILDIISKTGKVKVSVNGKDILFER
ncbi:MAG: hypothetical protein A2W90_07845 [Bacteroidetes bacterium GWF2_42_66]|nr:MAG: hypothetical protein A2W92_20470 [Bacteroidetes bacterium GWA2_42_15]OFX99707.1 MAG: hypothetical protein A2W89_03010 [Bacteroidetes bacterium GWE2_42_39]OFY39745.1 MAG: hypothetical protein A2W90_07845 [Bacteroidetes bacterium GWF2_42_66]HAZ02577.1 hypothetical protein [Marinilabiliales bacterium]HBL74838.1 hypothetical protein [Prolixibacteraceae bacterium]